MYNTRQVTPDITFVGGNDRRLNVFEGIYKVPKGISYNSYLLTDEKTVLFDTVDRAISDLFLENVEHTLGERELDYVVVQHMEPDHSATLKLLLNRYPKAVVVCSSKTKDMIAQFFAMDISERVLVVKEGDALSTGKHHLTFVMAPMVHWPEVMVTYDTTDKILFSADAFGTFGALDGAIFADEVDFSRDYMDEARRYYCNIVGKYGVQVQALLKKAASLEIKMLCPLHGFVWRKDLSTFIEKYDKWSSYTPEKQGVLIAYASIYGNIANAAEIVAAKLRERGVEAAVYDLSVTSNDVIVAEAFKWSNLLLASATYNGGIFIRMEEVLHDLVAHNIQNRRVAFIENGSWAPTAGAFMKKLLENCKNMTFAEEKLTIRSSLNDSGAQALDSLVNTISETIRTEKNNG